MLEFIIMNVVGLWILLVAFNILGFMLAGIRGAFISCHYVIRKFFGD